MSVVVLGANVPPVADDHTPPVAPPPTVPPKPTVTSLEQIVWLLPATAVAVRLMVIVIVEVTDGQGPVGSLDVKVTVALPAEISAAVGV